MYHVSGPRPKYVLSDGPSQIDYVYVKTFPVGLYLCSDFRAAKNICEFIVRSKQPMPRFLQKNSELKFLCIPDELSSKNVYVQIFVRSKHSFVRCRNEFSLR